MTNQSGCLPRYEDMTDTRPKHGERGHTWEPLVPLEIIWNYFIFRPDWIYNFDKYFPVLTSRWRCWMLNMMNEIFIRIKHRLGACQRWDVYFAQISGRKPAVLKFRSSSQPSPPPQHSDFPSHHGAALSEPPCFPSPPLSECNQDYREMIPFWSPHPPLPVCDNMYKCLYSILLICQ